MAKELTDNNIDEILASGKPFVADFWAQWCGPCKKIAPIIDELAEEYDGVIDIYKCDVEDNSKVCEQFGVINIPTVIFCKGGQVVDKQVGTASKKQFIEKIEKLK